jgi:hypothetical protein
MANNQDRTAPDRSRVAGTEEYEVRYLAEKNGISLEQARRLVGRRGQGAETRERGAARELHPH